MPGLYLTISPAVHKPRPELPEVNKCPFFKDFPLEHYLHSHLEVNLDFLSPNVLCLCLKGLTATVFKKFFFLYTVAGHIALLGVLIAHIIILHLLLLWHLLKKSFHFLYAM